MRQEVHWIVIEDAHEVSQLVKNILRSTQVKHVTHIAMNTYCYEN